MIVNVGREPRVALIRVGCQRGWQIPVPRYGASSTWRQAVGRSAIRVGVRVNETNGTSLGLKTDLTLIPRSLPPAQINYDQQPIFGFELVNTPVKRFQKIGIVDLSRLAR